ncbi:MAG: serine/threonine protein kinase [Deltaproteobacteria bacterium]|jgi:serine/threonine protein kinase|nr:serine/threonine protein kinase [Deltaproteobacteria bacterium]
MDQAPERLQNYELIRKLASGGMAEVFLAKQKSVGGFERLVCIKCILPHLSEQHDFITMFHDEARIVANFSHPNIAQIIEIGMDDGRAFIAMEYVKGEDLRTLYNLQAKLGEPVPLVYAAHITQSVAAGLDYAHARTDLEGKPLGIVHRDISPQNILVSQDGHVKVIDFGVAKAANKVNETRVGVLKGKYAYMSPEQAMGDPIDGRTDVFALAITLYEITTGARLFKRKNELETLHAVIECEITPPSNIIAGYDSELEKILLKALAHEPNDRYQTAGELEAALQTYLVSKDYHARPNILADYLTRLQQSDSSEPEPILDTDVSVDGLTKSQVATVANKFVAAAADVVPESVQDPAPMSFDAGQMDAGTIKLEEPEQPSEPPEEFADSDETQVVNRPQTLTAPLGDPEATVVKQMFGNQASRKAVKKPQTSTAVALLSVTLGLLLTLGGLYWKRSQEPAQVVRSGPVIVESKPPGASVIFHGPGSRAWNNKYLDEKTPIIIEEGLPSSSGWSVTLKKAGFEDVLISLPTFDPAPSPATVTIPLRIEYDIKNQGTVTLISDPPGAHVRIDGNDLMQVTPIQDWETSSKDEHEVEMILPGYLPHYEVFKVETDSHLSIRVELELESAQLDADYVGSQSKQDHIKHGYLTVRAPTRMRVFIDGKLSGVTPLKRRVLTVGEHQIEIRNAQSGLKLVRTTRIRPGSTSLVSISKKKGFVSINAKPWAKFKIGALAPKETPFRAPLLEGEYAIRFECPDGHTLTRDVSIKPGRTTPVVVDCEAE